MKVTSDDDNVWPPGFRFHPTDEELILYYLKRKICGRKLKLNIIGDTDVYKWHPEELPGLSKLKTGDRQWFFFSPRDWKYPSARSNKARSNRATKHGYWKATGKDRTVSCDSRDVGVKKTLVFYKGRAPTGERTDWVMHEYTLDEGELSRCTNVQNHYALYKAFKKSGPGPKNGEQYGAPFKEEDWADDEFCGFNSSIDQETPVEKPNKVDAVIEEREICEASQFSLEDLEKLMEQIPDESIFELPGADPCAYSVPQVAGQEESESTVVEPQDHILPRSVEVSHTNGQPCNIPGSFDFTESQLQLFETCDASYAPNLCAQASVLLEDDFLEIDDLNGPEFNLSSTEKPVGNLQFGELNGLCDLDQFHDATMFLNDLGPIDYENMPDLYLNENANNVVNPFDSQVETHLDCANANPFDNQIQWHDQAINSFTLSELQQDLGVQQTSGVLGDPSNFAAEMYQNQVEEDGSTADGITSALWAFIESIPTTPASAAENTLVNRTFDQMSSFRRRITTKNTTVSAINSSSQTTKWAGTRRFFLFSVLGALCAIFWVFIGTVRIWERSVSL